jgi:glycerol uptake facilitator-like aquaporin
MRVTTASYLAEFIGTFFFILSIFVSAGQPLVIGGALALVIFLIAGVSGGHVNPAVSVAMTLSGSLTPVELAGYVVAQIAGGAGAYYSYRLLK